MKVLIFGGHGKSTNAVINAIVDQYKDVKVILDDGVSKVEFLKRRINKLGLGTVIGQVAFVQTVPRILRVRSKGRIEEIFHQYHMDTTERYKKTVEVFNVPSINSDDVIRIVHEFRPDIIVVNGTRIIAEKILREISVPILNMHAGITPKYRGVHGGYWAIVNDDMENCGVTIHFVNAGIDTGNVIRQKRIEVTKQDNYVTYPFLQTGEGILLEKEILRQYDATGHIETMEVDLPSRLWTHPTLFQYLRNLKKSR